VPVGRGFVAVGISLLLITGILLVSFAIKSSNQIDPHLKEEHTQLIAEKITMAENQNDGAKKPGKLLKIVAISDTHNLHQHLINLEGDILIHCGDFSGSGSKEETKDFVKWMKKLPFKYKIVISGNMDDEFEAKADSLGEGIIYLCHTSTEIEGIRIFGSPYTPKFVGSFQLEDEAEATQLWDQVKGPVDILVTHGPPYGILDRTSRGSQVGDKMLLKLVEKLKPKYHLFGHVHNSHGKLIKGNTTFANVAQYDYAELGGKPFVFEYTV
jgi:Icc-related predicted phosphoesterase